MTPTGHVRRWTGSGATAQEGGPSRSVHAHHVLHFHGSTQALHEGVCDFLAEGAAAGEALLAIASEQTRAAISSRLLAEGLEAAPPGRPPVLHLESAEELLARFMSPEGRPVPERFHDEVARLLDRADAESGGRGTRVFGDMVDLLLEERRFDAALEVEDLWNEVGSVRPELFLLCGCSLAHLDRAEDGETLEALSRRHATVIPGGGLGGAGSEEASSREIALLQQRARALEVEVDRHRATERRLRRALDDRRRSEEEARRLQREFREAKVEAERANAAKSRFLAVVSHELRTPLTAIVGYQDLLDMGLKGPLTDGQRSFLDSIKSAAEQALALMEQLLSLSRIESGDERVSDEALDPCELVAEVAALVEPEARQKGLELDTRCGELPSSVRSDPVKLRQILLNLVSNAVKFTREGRVELSADEEGETLVWRVADTGLGIAREDRDRIFEHFTRLEAPGASRRGLGLGLALSRDLAALLGASIEVESEPGEGSTFSLRMPIRREAPSPGPS